MHPICRYLSRYIQISQYDISIGTTQKSVWDNKIAIKWRLHVRLLPYRSGIVFQSSECSSSMTTDNTCTQQARMPQMPFSHCWNFMTLKQHFMSQIACLLPVVVDVELDLSKNCYLTLITLSVISRDESELINFQEV